MGLLDFLSSSGGGGGLLDFLKNNAVNQQMMGGLPSDQAQYGQPQSAPQFAMPQQPIPQQPPPVIQAPQQPMQQPMQAPTPQDSGGGLGAGFRGMMANAQTGPIGALLGGVAGLAGMGQGSPQQVAAQQANVTAHALISKGVDPELVAAAVGNGRLPGNKELLDTLIKQNFGGDKFQVKQTGQNGLGVQQYKVFDPSTGNFKDIPKGEGDTAPGEGLGDTSKSGPEYLATLPKQVQGTVKGMIDGTIQPPSSFAAAKPYWQAMLAAAKNADPTFDENKWASRHKMSTDMAASGNSSMGGILSNGKSSFKHLAEYTDSAADLGNASHDFPGGSIVAHAQNAIGNTLGGSDTAAKIKAINDNLGHYGQESTKFYSGTGGGVEERMNALKEMNPTTTSSAEMAAYANKEKSLMLDRLREKEAQIRDTMGEGYLQQHPVFTPELQNDIARIDANVAKLRGNAPTANAPAAQAPDRSAIEAEMRRRGLMK